MAINFPSSPSNGQEYSENGIKWAFNSTFGVWYVVDSFGTFLANTSNNQILYNFNNGIIGSNGITYNSTSNTVFVNTLNASANVVATYFIGDGSKLSGVTTDISPPFNKANSANIIASAAFDKANAANLLAYNTGIGANSYATTVGASSNTIASAAFNKANSANLVASSAYDAANSALAAAVALAIALG